MRGENDVAQRRRERVAMRTVYGEQLLGEEDVAVGADEGAVDELGRRLTADDGCDQLSHFVAVEPVEVDPFDRSRPVELGEQRAEWVAAVEVVGPVRADEEQRCAVEAAGEVGEELAGGTVGPVEVFEHEQGRRVVGQPFEHPEKLFEQGARDDAFPHGRVQLGEERGELLPSRTDHRVERALVEGAVQHAQHLHDRPERQRPIGKVETLADEHQGRIGDAGGQLADEARLSDTGFASDEHHRAALVGNRRLPRLLEARQLGASTYEPRARDPFGHALQFGAGVRRPGADFHGCRPGTDRSAIKRLRASEPAIVPSSGTP